MAAYSAQAIFCGSLVGRLNPRKFNHITKSNAQTVEMEDK